MMFPLRFRQIHDGTLIFANDAGDFFLGTAAFLERYVLGKLTEADQQFLERHGHWAESETHLAYFSYLQRVAERFARREPISYVILVPTLRCNLSCSYCQVSRVAETATGFDWSEATLAAVIQYLDSLETDELKIEFQGGEPTLRIDLLERIYDFAKRRFSNTQFVVCTNLQWLSHREWEFLRRPDVFVSTSLDGDSLVHQRNRTSDSSKTTQFFENLARAVDTLGVGKVSALPTIDFLNPPSINSLIDAFTQFGFHTIYLRPVNYQGFARKSHSAAQHGVRAWNAYYFDFIEALVERNYGATAPPLGEYYFTLCLNRILRGGKDDHVDLRNPLGFGSSYLVIDHDGAIYPTDEARMITRVGQIDLSIGHVLSGIDSNKLVTLNEHAINNVHEDCIHCVYQPYCGTDLIDDLSRYGRIDVRKNGTWFCERHIAVFDRAMSYLYSTDPKIRHSVCHWLGIYDGMTEIAVRHHDSACS